MYNHNYMLHTRKKIVINLVIMNLRTACEVQNVIHMQPTFSQMISQ